MEHCLKLDLAQQLLRENDLVSFDDQVLIENICAQRFKRIPLQYCLGHTYFWAMKFTVRPGVFIPRTDTESLVQVALNTFRDKPPTLIADIGTGSGVLAIALATELTQAKIIAIDISDKALELAKQNAEVLGVAQHIEFIKGHWRSVLPKNLDAIISNPPYINSTDRESLPPEVVQYEPEEALFGPGPDGLGFYRELAQAGAMHLKPGGYALLELGDRQAAGALKIFEDAGWESITQYNDLNGLPRVLSARLAKAGF